MKYTVTFPEREPHLAEVDCTVMPGVSSWKIETPQHQVWEFENTQCTMEDGKLEVVFEDGRRMRFPVAVNRKDNSVIIATPLGSMRVLATRGTGAGPAALQQSKSLVKSSMPGKILKILCEKGQSVEADQPILIMEAMKMENEIRAPRAGVIEQIAVLVGQAVETGALLVQFEDKND